MKIRQGNFVLVFYSNLKSCELRLDPNHGTIINLKYVASFFSLLRAIEKVNQKLENSSHNGEKMKSLQIEICSQLSVSKNVKEIMKIAQIPVKSETDSYPDIAVIFHDLLVANQETLLSGIEGDEVDGNLHLETLLTEEKIQFLINYMKLSPEELSLCSLEDAVAMKIAVKDV
jgi:hypothetical protein